MKNVGDVLGSVVVFNPSVHERESLIEFTLPLAEGDLVQEDRVFLTAGGHTFRAKPFGARWPDGSARYLRCRGRIRTRVTGFRKYELVLADLSLDGPPEWDAALISAVMGTQVGMLHSPDDGATHKITPFGAFRLLESGPEAMEYRASLRIPDTPLWATITVILPTLSWYARFVLEWGCSKPGQGVPTFDTGTLTLRVQGALVKLDHGKALATQQEGEATTVLLSNPTRLPVGTAQTVHGRLLWWSPELQTHQSYLDSSTLLAEREYPLLAQADRETWVRSKAFGTFGDMGEAAIPKRDDVVGKYIRLYRGAGGQPWEQGIVGLAPDPGRTGAQDNFGILRLRDIVLAEAPAALHAIQRAMSQEACRPTHHREMNVEPFAIEDHPNLATWAGIPHIRHVWVDDFGAGYRDQDVEWLKSTPWGRPWQGRDSQHWTCLTLAFYALVTGERWAREECEHLAQLWMAEHQWDPRINAYRDHAPRSIGRSQQSAALLYLVTGNERLRAKAIELLDHYPKVYAGRSHAPHPAYQERPDLQERWQIPWRAWTPWEEAIMVRGLWAAWKVFGHEGARDLALTIAGAVVRWGMTIRPDGAAGVGYRAPLWDNGSGTPWETGEPDFYDPDDPPDWPADWQSHVDYSSQVFDWGGIATCVIAMQIVPKEKAKALLKARFPNGNPEPLDGVWNDLLIEGWTPAELGE